MQWRHAYLSESAPWQLSILFLLKYLHLFPNSKLTSSASCILFYPFRFADFILKRLCSLVGTFSQPWGHLTAGHAGETSWNSQLQHGFYLHSRLYPLKFHSFFFVGGIQLYWKKENKITHLCLKSICTVHALRREGCHHNVSSSCHCWFSR